MTLVIDDRRIVRLVGGDRLATFLELFPPFGGDLVLPKLTLSGSFTVAVEVGADHALPELTLAGSFTVAVATGSSALVLPELTISGSPTPQVEVSGALVLPEVTLTGSFTVGVAVSGSLVLPELTLAGAFTVAVELGSSALVLPELALTGSFSPVVEFTGALVLPELALAGSFSPVVEFAGALVLPELALAGSFTVAVDLGSSALVLPELTLAGSFTVAVAMGSSALVLPELTISGSPTPQVEVSGALVLPELALAGSFSPVVEFAGSLVLPEITLAGSWHYTSPQFAAVLPTISAVVGSVLSVPWPAHQTDDIGLLIVESANPPSPPPAPSGWTDVPNGSQGGGAANGTLGTRIQVFWRRATSNGEADAALAGGSSNHTSGAILVFRGCIPTGDPVDVSVGTVPEGSDTAAVTIPGATTTVDNCLIVAIASWSNSSASAQQSGEANASLTALTERYDQGTALGNGGGFAVVTGIKAAAGAYSATTATHANASRHARVSLALKPNP